MKKFCSLSLSTLITCTLVSAALPSLVLAQDDAPAASPIDASAVDSMSKAEDRNQITSDGKIRFSFQDQDWKDVIPWFAEQAGYSLQPITEWPEGVFNLQDNEDYTVLQALDQLNYALRMHKPAFTLVRNRKMLVLAREEDEANFPNDLVETVEVEDLENRGKHETIACIFDLGSLNANDIYDQLMPLIGERHRSFYAVFPSANQIHVRETGGQLRNIRDLINASRRQFQIYRLKHEEAESFMMVARGLLGMEEGQNSRNDGSLSVTIQPFSDRLFLSGTREKIKLFEEVAAIVDAPSSEEGTELVLSERRMQVYPVFTDPSHTYKVLETMLESFDDVLMDQDEITGAITILARDDAHARAQQTLDALSSQGSDTFKILQLQNADPSDIIIVLQSMFRQSALDDTASGPVLMANSELNQILVKGTPQEVVTVEKMVSELDRNSIPVASGPRTGHRVISVDSKDQDRLAPLLEDYFLEKGRRNSFNIILPENRGDFRSNMLDRVRGNFPGQGNTPTNNPREIDPLDIEALELEPSPSQKPQTRGNDRRPDRRQGSSQINESLFLLGTLGSQLVGIEPIALSGVSLLQDSDDLPATKKKNASDYRPAPQVQSVPGAPVVARFIEGAIILDSDDLDALDDLETIIRSQVGETSEVQKPTFFAIQYRKADKMLNSLETYFGISSGGGGGGGGGDLMTGMLNNMTGGAGDLLGGLLGGSGGGGSSSGTLEGEVRFIVDMPFNMVVVTGATGNDLDEISELIELLDQPEAPHDPKLLGQTRTIDIIHRDPEDLKTLIENQLRDLIDTGEKAQNGGGGNNEAAQMMKMMQQLAGGGGKGGGGNNTDYEAERPKLILGVDNLNRQLLVTGPEYLYQEVVRIVISLDIPREAPSVEFLPRVQNMDAVKRTLKAMLTDQIEIVDETTASSNGNTRTTSGGTPQGAVSADAAAKQQEARAQMINAFRQMGAQQRGGGQRGGGQRGGGQRGGGGGGRGR